MSVTSVLLWFRLISVLGLVGVGLVTVLSIVVWSLFQWWCHGQKVVCPNPVITASNSLHADENIC